MQATCICSWVSKTKNKWQKKTPSPLEKAEQVSKGSNGKWCPGFPGVSCNIGRNARCLFRKGRKWSSGQAETMGGWLKEATPKVKLPCNRDSYFSFSFFWIRIWLCSSGQTWTHDLPYREMGKPLFWALVGSTKAFFQLVSVLTIPSSSSCKLACWCPFSGDRYKGGGWDHLTP